MAAQTEAIQINATPEMRILKFGTCPSLSGLSEISYMAGCPIDSQSIADACLKISGNTSSGKWNGDWIQISRIDRLLSKLPKDQSFTAAEFHPLYPNASSNSPGFMAGICLHLCLITRVSGGRAYVRDSGEMFWAEMEKALAAGTSLEVPPMDKPAGHSGSSDSKGKSGKKKPAVALVNPVI